MGSSFWILSTRGYESPLDEANKLGMGSTAHLAQTGVAQMNAADAARLALQE